MKKKGNDEERSAEDNSFKSSFDCHWLVIGGLSRGGETKKEKIFSPGDGPSSGLLFFLILDPKWSFRPIYSNQSIEMTLFTNNILK